MDKPLVSVIIAAYNVDRYLSGAIDSILKQTYDNFEIWICDDCSNDNTYEVALQYSLKDSRIHILHNDHNRFSAYSRNLCIFKCSGEYVMIQDGDDVCEENRMELLVSAIQRTSADFVSSGHYLFDENGAYKTWVPKEKAPVKRSFLSGMPFCHAATLFKKECLIAVEGYRIGKETRCGQDYDLFMRLYANGYCGINISDILYGYRVDRDTIARRKFKYRLDECVIRYKGFKNLGLLPFGIVYVLKPIPAYFMQLIKGNRG